MQGNNQNERERAIIETIDTAIYDTSPEIHADMPKLAAVIFAAMKAYDVAKAEAIRKEIDGLVMAERGIPDEEAAFLDGTEWDAGAVRAAEIARRRRMS